MSPRLHLPISLASLQLPHERAETVLVVALWMRACGIREHGTLKATYRTIALRDLSDLYPLQLTSIPEVDVPLPVIVLNGLS